MMMVMMMVVMMRLWNRSGLSSSLALANRKVAASINWMHLLSNMLRCWDAERWIRWYIYMVISSCFFIFKVNLLTAQNTHTLIVTIGDPLGPIWTFLDHLWTRGTLCFTKKLFFSERVQKAVTISNHSCWVFLWDLNSDVMTEKRMERCPLKSQEHWIKHQIKIQTKANR